MDIPSSRHRHRKNIPSSSTRRHRKNPPSESSVYTEDANSARDGDNCDESSDEEFFRFLFEDDDITFVHVCNSMLQFAIHLDNLDEKEEAVRVIKKHMRENARIRAKRNQMLKEHLENKQRIEVAKAQKIRYVQQLARECGVDEGNPQLWCAVHKITKDDIAMEFFIETEARLAIIDEYNASVNN